MTDLSPPWILFIDCNKPVAILPAGRLGEVANVEHLSMEQAKKVVRLANEIHHELVEAKMVHLWELIKKTTLMLAETGAPIAEDGRPSCSGKWISGSGGHRTHEPCGAAAKWWHPDDMYAYCAAHLHPSDEGRYVRWPKLKETLKDD